MTARPGPAVVTGAGPGGDLGRAARRAQAAVVVVFFVHGLLFASWTAHIPHVKRALGIDDGTLGLALLGMPIGSVTATLLAGLLIPRFGSRALVRVCVVGYSLAGPVVGLTGSVPGLFAALFLWGAFQGSLDVSMNTAAIAVERQRRRPIMNGMHACWSLGAFAGAGAGALGVALGLSLTPQLLILGVPALIVAGLLTTRLLTDRLPRPEEGAVAEPRTRRFTRDIVALGAIAFASMLCEGAAADWSSVYLHDTLGAGAGVAGLGYTSFALAMMIVRLAGNRLIAAFGVRRLLPALALLASAAMTAALVAGVVALTLVALFLLGLGVGSVVPSAFSAAGRLPGMHPGVGVANVSGIAWAGFVCGPPLIGQLAGVTSLTLALGVVPVLTALIAIGVWRVAAIHTAPDDHAVLPSAA